MVTVMRNTATKLVVFFLSTMLLFSLFPANAVLADSDSGKCGENLTWILDGDGTLTIKGSGDMYCYGSIPADERDEEDAGEPDPSPWNSNSNVKRVVFEGTVTSIGNYAFAYCTGLTSVTIPETVTAIKRGAFYFCERLTSVKIPDSVTTIGKEAFSFCEKLSEVNIPKDLKKIDEWTFESCTSLKNIRFPEGVTVISSAAFGDSGLTCIKLPASLTTIGWGAFSGSKIKNVVIPSNVTTIDCYAFSECKNLKSVSGGAGVKTIGKKAFSECKKLKSFSISSPVLKKIGSYAFDKDSKLKTIKIRKTAKLTKKGVRNSLKGSKIWRIKAKKSKLRKYRVYFRKANSGRYVKLTK